MSADLSRYGIYAFNLIDRFPAVALSAAIYVFEQVHLYSAYEWQ